MENKIYCCRGGDDRWKAYVTDENWDTYLKTVEATTKPTEASIMDSFNEAKGKFRQVTFWNEGLLSAR
jgi:hypothetical protein